MRTARSNVVTTARAMLVCGALGAPCGAALAACDGQWAPTAHRAGPFERRSAGVAYDAARDRVVMFGGNQGGAAGSVSNETWEWDGARWSLASPGLLPAARTTAPLVFDSLRGRCVLFGGVGSAGYLGDTWAWNGSQWAQITSAGPSARRSAAMAYDSARDRVVLFGGLFHDGVQGIVRYDETWEFDGVAWTQRFPTTSPTARDSACMAYDAARARCVLYGGGGPGATLGFAETWEWDGAEWLLRPAPPTNDPGPRTGAAMAYDAGRALTVMYGGDSLNDTWEWDGAVWARRLPAPGAARPGGGAGWGLAYDSRHGRMVLRQSAEEGTWAWDGQAWSVLAASAGGVHALEMAYDPVGREVLMYDGTSTRTWNGSAWGVRARLNQGSPPQRTDRFVLATDTLRRQVVLFGGRHATPQPPVLMGDTWVWDGATWSVRTALGPPAGSGGAMAYDRARDRMVLLTDARETWLWNGSAWSQGASSGQTAAGGFALAYDPLRERVVMFGGRAGGALQNETWTWDGVAWTRQFPAQSPPARLDHAMAFDADCGRVVMFGGSVTGMEVNDSWTWDGVNWSPRPQAAPPRARALHAMAHDERRHTLVMYGGLLDDPSPNATYDLDTWSLAGDPCPGDANFDRVVNFADLNGVLSNFGRAGSALPGDLDNDGYVTFADLNIVLGNFGTIC